MKVISSLLFKMGVVISILLVSIDNGASRAQFLKKVVDSFSKIDPTNQHWSRPAFRDWAPGIREGLYQEVYNCSMGSGCDLRKTNPYEMLKTVSGARAYSAAMQRWTDRQGRNIEAQYEDKLQQLRSYISRGYKCLEFVEFEGWCETMNSLLKLNMEWERYGRPTFSSMHSRENVEFIASCLERGMIPLEGTREFRCFTI